MAGVKGARAVGAEPRDRADDGIVADAGSEALPDAGAKSFDHHVGLSQDRRGRLGACVPRDDLLASIESPIPLGRDRVAFGRLELDDPRPEPQQLTCRERAREVPRQIGDEGAGKRLHGRRLHQLPALSPDFADSDFRSMI